jgi:hypothetical protein
MAPNSRTWMSPTMPWPSRLTRAAWARDAQVQMIATMTIAAGIQNTACSGETGIRPQSFTGTVWSTNRPLMAGSSSFSVAAFSPPAATAHRIEANRGPV